MKNKGYIKIPKAVFADEFKGLSCHAILLYGILCDRNNLSLKNAEKFSDESGRVYIIFTIKMISDIFNVGKSTAMRMLKELEKAGLIRKRHQGMGKPNIIYVTEFEEYSNEDRSQFDTIPDLTTDRSQFDTSRSIKNDTSVVSFWECNNKEYNKPQYNKPDLSKNNRKEIEDEVMEQIEFEILSERNYGHLLKDLATIIIDEICDNSEMARIGDKKISRDDLRQRLRMVDSSHIEYVIECFRENTAEIKNIRAYLLAMLYNAPVTMEAYYDAMYKRDMMRLYN